MATQTLVPDGVLLAEEISSTLSNYTVQDGTWAAATTAGSSAVRVSFPTPSNPPRVGAGLQTFNAFIRKNASGGNNIDWAIELWANGSSLGQIASGTGFASATGATITGTWNANLLSVASGADVECRVVQTGGATGSPAGRRYMEVDYIEWVVDLELAQTITAGFHTEADGSFQHSLTTGPVSVTAGFHVEADGSFLHAVANEQTITAGFHQESEASFQANLTAWTAWTAPGSMNAGSGWTGSVGNLAADDGSFVSYGITNSALSTYLTVTNFGFNFEAGVTIGEVEVETRFAGQGGSVQINDLYLTKDGASNATASFADTSLVSGETTLVHDGGELPITFDDVAWGVSLAEADLESAAFGVRLRADAPSNAYTQRVAPNGTVFQSGWTNYSVAHIDDDPTAPDGNRILTNGSSNGTVVVSFPTPPDPLRTGTALQKVRCAFTRTTGNSAENTPISLYIYEGGVLRATLMDAVNISNTINVTRYFERTWDASVLSDKSGANLEVQVGLAPTTSTGSYSNFDAVDVLLDMEPTHTIAIDRLRVRVAYQPPAGTPAQTITAPFHAEAETSFQHALSVGSVTITAPLHSEAETSFLHTIDQGNVNITAGFHTEPEASFLHALTTGPVSVTAPLHGESETSFLHEIEQAAVGITAGFHQESETSFGHSLTLGPVSIVAAFHGEEETSFLHSIGVGATNIVAGLHAEADVSFQHTLTVGPISVAASLHGESEASFTHVITQEGGPQTLVADFHQEGEASFLHDLTYNQTVTAGLHGESETSFGHTIDVGSIDVVVALYGEEETSFQHSLLWQQTIEADLHNESDGSFQHNFGFKRALFRQADAGLRRLFAHKGLWK